MPTVTHSLSLTFDNGKIVVCPDCNQLELWSQEEIDEHGYCKTYCPYPVEDCPAC
jgi:hypothetical protein